MKYSWQCGLQSVSAYYFHHDIKLRISSPKFTFLLAPPSETTLLLLNCPSNENIAIQTVEVLRNRPFNIQTFRRSKPSAILWGCKCCHDWVAWQCITYLSIFTVQPGLVFSSKMAEKWSLQLAFALIALIAAIFYSGKAQFVFNKINQIIHGKRGCSPIFGIGHVTLHYFGLRGRAEGIRLMLEDFEIPYMETNYTKETWPEIKKKGIETGLFTFGQGKAKMIFYRICKRCHSSMKSICLLSIDSQKIREFLC